jgi:predicted NUDIX family NTP pyrophosphohydrolase
MYRRSRAGVEVFLIHPGGPYFVKKDKGAWAIPKGEYDSNEDPLDAAKREFLEETGFPATGKFLDLGSIKQTSGKLVAAWAFEGDCDPADLRSNTCLIEWPPHSARETSGTVTPAPEPICALLTAVAEIGAATTLTHGGLAAAIKLAV